MRHLFLASLLCAMACNGSTKSADEPEICGNGFDDDGNGVSDCADPACADTTCPEVCDDAVDNDLDGDIDCEDAGCDGGCPEVCDDERDNDGDGAWDCDDSECASLCDADGDGFANEAMGGDDCDDNDPNVYPLALEVCDGVDNDCNDLVDRQDPGLDRDSVIEWFLDADNDGYGDPTDSVGDCFQPLGRVDNDLDCNDNDASVNPLTPEVCNGLDDNCDGLVDDEDPLLDPSTGVPFYLDADGDGFGESLYYVLACTAPPGYVADDTDCDDGDPGTHGPGMWLLDSDQDDYGSGVPVGPYGCTPPGPDYVSEGGLIDCNDGDPTVNPGAYDICEDGIDQDCNYADRSCTTLLYTVRTSDDMLVEIDTQALTLTDVGLLGAGFDFGEVAWDPGNQTMYMVDGRPLEALYTVNMSTGAATLVGVHGITDLFGLAVDPVSGTMYGSGESPSGLYSMDRATGAATWIGDPFQALDGLTWDSLRNELIGLEAGSGDLFRIDPATGNATLLSANGWINNCGLAYDPAGDLFWALDWSGDLYSYDPNNGYLRTGPILSGLGAHDGLSLGM